jgi:hypothetical protein
MYSTIEKYGKSVVIGFEKDLINEGCLEVLELEIDGKDCTAVLEFGNVAQEFEELILKQTTSC